MSNVPEVTARRRILSAIGLALLAAWGIWWIVALYRIRLPFAEHTWMRTPVFGADFWSQSDYAARLWRHGVDPYENERHLFHYPPIVIRLFLWTPFLTMPTALRIWVVVLAVLLVVATVLAHRTRNRLGAGDVPLPLLLALVLFSFPSVFTLERSNFDLITLAALLVAAPVLEATRAGTTRAQQAAEFAAGAVLAFGPWVKIYPGVLAVGLLALRRYRALAGFVAGGVAIGVSMPEETRRSFEVLAIAIARTKKSVHGVPFGVWSHSLSVGWMKLVESLPDGAFSRALSAVPGSAFALLLLGGPLAWVALRVFRCRPSAPLTYPLLLWCIALGSYVPEIANDYSLTFLPLAAAAVLGSRDTLTTRLGAVLAIPALQPVAFPVPGGVLLIAKCAGLFAVGASLVDHARRLQGAGAAPDGSMAGESGTAPARAAMTI